MQADYAASAFAKDAAEWTDPRQNIEFGCNELASDLQHYKTRFADLPEAKQLQAAIAAYNTGPGNVDRSLSKGRDVWARLFRRRSVARGLVQSEGFRRPRCHHLKTDGGVHKSPPPDSARLPLPTSSAP
jgi:hypothetical protein